MPFDSFSSLQASILQFLGRPGDPNIPVEDIISLFEADASTRLRTHFQETQTNLYTVGELDTYDLPDDFEEIREVSITSLDPIVVLDYQTPSQLDDTWIDEDPDQPVNYTLEGTQIRFAPIPDGQYTIRIEYFQAIVPLADNSYAATSLNSITAAGHGYAVGDELLVAGGALSPNSPLGTVLTVDSVSTANTYSSSGLSIAAAGQNYLAGDILSLSGGTYTQVVEITVDTVQAATTYTASLTDINNGGTSYNSGDVLSVIGGTVISGQATRITVDSVSSGVITAAHLTQNGQYSTYPANPVTVSGGTGTGATFDLSFTELLPQGAILTAHVSNGGAYTVQPSSPTPSINGAGTGATFNMTFIQDTFAGEITAAHISEAGDYATHPINPVAVTGGSGSGTPNFNLTYTQSGGDTNWLLQKYPQLYLYGSLAEAELFLGADNSNDRFQLFVARRDDLYNKITLQDRKYRYGGASLQIRTDVGNP